MSTPHTSEQPVPSVFPSSKDLPPARLPPPSRLYLRAKRGVLLLLLGSLATFAGVYILSVWEVINSKDVLFKSGVSLTTLFATSFIAMVLLRRFGD
jgi:hypothetical protein